MSVPPLRDSVAEVDLDAIAANTAALRGRSGVPLIAVVKADGYGHGVEAASRACLEGGADMLAVATVEEAQILRDAAFATPLLVLLGVGSPQEARAVADLVLHVAAWREDQLAWLDEAGRTADRSVGVHVKVDTGLTRLGVHPTEVPKFVRSVRHKRGLRLEGLYTHLATSDELDPSFAFTQVETFRLVIGAVDGPPEWQHALATAGILVLGREGAFTAVRPGIGLYGVPPAPHLAVALPLRPALSLYTRLARVRRVPAGTGVSYGHAYVTDRERLIGTVPFGYGDGLPRRASPGGHLLVRGRLVAIVGRVCMDLCMVDLSDVPDAREGDVVTIIGASDGTWRSADDLASELGTINYEVLTNIHPRVPRVYRRGGRVVGTKTAAAGYVAV